MNTTIDRLVTRKVQSHHIETNDISFSSFLLENMTYTSTDESILDLSQRPSTTKEIIDSNDSIHFIDNWTNNSTCFYSDNVDDDLKRILIKNQDKQFNIEQSLTDQFNSCSIEENSLSDNSNLNPTQINFNKTRNKTNSSYRIKIHELIPCSNSCFSLSSSNFLWSKYLSQIGERPVSEKFFDHYLASIESGFKTDMKLEYCYDTQRDLYWLTQIQLVSHYLIRLRFVGLPENDTSNDFWEFIYGERCHPIGWCKENSKLMLPPPIITKRAYQQTTPNHNFLLNGNDKQSSLIKRDNEDLSQTAPAYLFDKEIGVTPVEQLKIGMLLELQDINRPWTSWFVQIINNRGGRLHLRYVTTTIEDNNDQREEKQMKEEEAEDSRRFCSDIHLFYLDRRVHFVGWTLDHSPTFFYDIPICLTLSIDKQLIIDMCLDKSKKQYHPSNLFKEQEEIIKHRFIEGIKLEVFQTNTQNVHIGRIGHIHNEYYFDVIIDNDQGNEISFVAHSNHPHILPPHWAAEHKLVLMKGENIRQSEDYWNLYTENNGKSDLAPDRCFNLLTIHSSSVNRVEPGMKMEMIYTLNRTDYVFSVTLIHIVDHLMWLRVDDATLFGDEHSIYHVLPINSLDVFPIGWAKFNGFQLITPNEYKMDINTYEQDRYDLFSSVTHYPKIPRVYLNEVYFLTIYVNIRCFCGPYFCSSRLARIPSKFGPGPYRNVLIDMFHHLLSTLSTNSHRALRRLDHQINNSTTTYAKREYIKVAKRSPKSIRPITIPNEPSKVYLYLRHICTQLESCPNLISVQSIDNNCPDKCHLLHNTFAFSTHSKRKRTQIRATQHRYRKEKSLLGHLKTPTIAKNASSPATEEIPSNDLSTEVQSIINSKRVTPSPVPGSDRQTRGFRVHIEPKTHTITRTNKKSKQTDSNAISTIKQESIEINNVTSEASSSSTCSSSTISHVAVKESRHSRSSKTKRSLSPTTISPVKFHILTQNIQSVPSSNKPKKQRKSPSLENPNSSPNQIIPTIENQQSTSSTIIRSTQYSIPQNPVTWNVNDVCWYLDESDCSFALKKIQEQEIDGAALLLIDDISTVQDLLKFKLGPAVKFWNVVEQLRTQVIDTIHSSPSLKSSRLSTS